ncbi:somatostatin receptor type 5-like [Babylonia areolata]|uniref:somatostatin receptor type 5-like n=1 Tax=Babylonia areolata TaxID=304850 RepID=UPI003FD23FA0
MSTSVPHGDAETNTTLADVIANVTDEIITAAATNAGRLPGLVDAATKDLVVEVVNCYLLPVVFLLGVSGNAMSMVVLMVHGMDTSTNVLLLGLTLSDLCYLLTMFARKVSCIVSKFDYVTSREIEIGLLPTVYMVNRVFGLCTPFLTMVITAERCLAVSLPFKVQKLVTPLRMKIVVVCVFLFSICAIGPFFAIYEVKWMPDRRTGELIPMLSGTRFYFENLDVITAYNNIALSGLYYFGPMGIIIVCTIFILVTVRRSSQWRQTAAKGGETAEERRITKMLMTVVLVYICMYIPGATIGIANQVSPDFGSLGGRYNNLFYLVGGLQLLLYACNSSCNFIIYMLLSKKFYKTYLRVFLCRREGANPRQRIPPVSDARSSTKVAIVSSASHSSAGEN